MSSNVRAGSSPALGTKLINQEHIKIYHHDKT